MYHAPTSLKEMVDSVVADVSIYHYANAKVSGRKGRITKAVTTAVIEGK